MPPTTTTPWQLWRTRCLIASALVVLVSTAVVQGLWTDRWSEGRDLEQALRRLGQVPEAAGDWKGWVEDLDPEQVEQGKRVGIAGMVRHRFQRSTDGQNVSVILMCGRFGPLSVHTPDVCYGSAGYVVLGSPTRMEFRSDDGSEASFWTARFHKPNSPEAPPLRIFWGWNASEGWKAPGSPRWAFRMKPVLFKLYVARELASLEEDMESDAGLAFLRTWLPRLNSGLFQ